MARAIGFSRNARTRSMPRYWNGFKAWPRRILQSSARMLHLVFDGRILAETVSDWTWIKISDFDRVKEVLFVNHWGFTRGSACPSQPSPAPWLSRWPALA